MASEEDAVAFGAELGEVGVGRRWVGFEVEAVSGFRRRGGGNSNSMTSTYGFQSKNLWHGERDERLRSVHKAG